MGAGFFGWYKDFDQGWRDLASAGRTTATACSTEKCAKFDACLVLVMVDQFVYGVVSGDCWNYKIGDLGFVFPMRNQSRVWELHNIVFTKPNWVRQDMI